MVMLPCFAAVGLAQEKHGGASHHCLRKQPLPAPAPPPLRPQVFDVLTGQQVRELKQGHYEPVNACCYNPLMGELYTGGADGAILIWAAEAAARAEEESVWGGTGGWQGEQHQGQPAAGREPVDCDAWSDDSY